VVPRGPGRAADHDRRVRPSGARDRPAYTNAATSIPAGTERSMFSMASETAVMTTKGPEPAGKDLEQGRFDAKTHRGVTDAGREQRAHMLLLVMRPMGYRSRIQ
jgi:hypothetical protein